LTPTTVLFKFEIRAIDFNSVCCSLLSLFRTHLLISFSDLILSDVGSHFFAVFCKLSSETKQK
jgi:hypothetical protein